MIQFLKDVLIGMLLLSGITFFGVLIWSMIHAIAKYHRDNK